MRRLNDSELVALAAIANCFAAEVLASDEIIECPAAPMLRAEMRKRGLLGDAPSQTTLLDFVERGLQPGAYSSVKLEITQHSTGERVHEYSVYRTGGGWHSARTPDEALRLVDRNANDPETSADESRAEVAALGDLPEVAPDSAERAA